MLRIRASKMNVLAAKQHTEDVKIWTSSNRNLRQDRFTTWRVNTHSTVVVLLATKVLVFTMVQITSTSTNDRTIRESQPNLFMETVTIGLSAGFPTTARRVVSFA